MAHISSKIAPFPGRLDTRTNVSEGEAPELNDPTKELRAYIERLQAEARDSKQLLEAAEEDRDRLTEDVKRLQRELELAHQSRDLVRELTVERDTLLANQEKQSVMQVETRRRAEAAERQKQQVESQRDEALGVFKELRKEADQHVAARDEAVRQRDAALRQRAQVTKERDELTSRLADAQRQLAEAQRALVEAQSGASKRADGEIQKQILSIRQARDSAAAQAAELRTKVAELEDVVANLTYDHELAEKAAAKAQEEVVLLRDKAEADLDRFQMLETLQAELAEVAEELRTLREQHAGLHGAKEQLAIQLREFRENHEAMLIAKMSQLETTSKERDLLRSRLQERDTQVAEVRAELAAAWSGAMQVTEPEINRLTKEVESLRARAAEVDVALGRSEELSRQRDEMRLQVIELTAQLENARREIKDIGAMLAEARLQAKLGKKGTVPISAIPSRSAQTGSAAEKGASRYPNLRLAYDKWVAEPEDRTTVWDLAREVAAFSGSCQAGGQPGLSRLSGALSRLIEVFVETPAGATAAQQGVIEDAIELLGKIEAAPGRDHELKLTGARAYVVDGDEEACAASTELLRTAGFVVDSTEHPSGALARLASEEYDVILLETDLPEINGFELCGYLRGMEQHATTPVLFMTAGGIPEEMAEADFVAKPILPAELVLRAMLIVAKRHAAS